MFRVDKTIITFKDRLFRFGSEIIFELYLLFYNRYYQRFYSQA